MNGTPTKFTCHYCGGEGVKELGAINAARKAGRNIYCSRACSIKGRRTRTPEMRAEYMRKYREAHRAKACSYARDYREGKRGTPREKVLAMQRATYQRHRAKNLQSMKAWREKNPDKVRANIDRWLRANPHKADLYAAKTALAVSLGVPRSEIPWDLAEAKAALWQVMRWVKEQRAAIAGEARSGETVQQGSTGTASTRAQRASPTLHNPSPGTP